MTSLSLLAVRTVELEVELVERFNNFVGKRQYEVSIYNTTNISATRGVHLVPIGIHVPTFCLYNTELNQIIIVLKSVIDFLT